MARGALLGARGNSGVILVADAARPGRRAGARRRPPAGGRWPARCAGGRRRRTRRSPEPVEGTVLSWSPPRRPPRRPRRPTRTTWPRWRGPPPTAPRRRWPGPRSSCRRWPGPAWSTPAGGAWSCCWTRWSRWSPGHARRPPRWPGGRATRALLDGRPGRPARPSYAYEVQYLLDAAGAAVERAAGGAGRRSATRWSSSVRPDRRRRSHLERARARQRRRGGDRGGVGAGRPHRISVTRFADQIAGTRPPDRRRVPSRRGCPSARPPAVVVIARRARAGRAVRRRGRLPWSTPGRPATRRPAECWPRSGPPAARPGGAAAQRPGADRRRSRPAAAGEARDGRHPGRRWCRPARRCRRWPRWPCATRRRRFDDDVIAMAEAAGACRYARSPSPPARR